MIHHNILNGKQHTDYCLCTYTFRNKFLYAKEEWRIDRFLRDVRAATYIRSDCSGFLQDDITVANQLRWELSEIASGVIRFKSTVDIRRSDMKAPKADRIMRTQAIQRTQAYCAHTHYALA